jgi:hypothetical protein
MPYSPHGFAAQTSRGSPNLYIRDLPSIICFIIKFNHIYRSWIISFFSHTQFVGFVFFKLKSKLRRELWRVYRRWVKQAELLWQPVLELWRPWKTSWESAGGIMSSDQPSKMPRTISGPCLRPRAFLLQLLQWLWAKQEKRNWGGQRNLWGRSCTWAVGVPIELRHKSSNLRRVQEDSMTTHQTSCRCMAW